MIKGIGKKVVIMKNTECDYIEQAIFIVKNNKNINQADLLDECENIINKIKQPKRKNTKLKVLISAAILIQTIITLISISLVL